MMYTVIVSEKEVCTLGGCHRWVSEKLKFVLVQFEKCLKNVAYIVKSSGTVSFNMHACVWPNDFAHYWFM